MFKCSKPSNSHLKDSLSSWPLIWHFPRTLIFAHCADSFPLQLNISHPDLNVHPSNNLIKDCRIYMLEFVHGGGGFWRNNSKSFDLAISISVLQQILCLKPILGGWAFAALNQLSGSISYIILSIICEPPQFTFTSNTIVFKFAEFARRLVSWLLTICEQPTDILRVRCWSSYIWM